jgi:hypothetical protein
MRSFSYSDSLLQGSPFIRWHHAPCSVAQAGSQAARGVTENYNILRTVCANQLMLPDTRASWQRKSQSHQLMSLNLSTITEVRSGHGQQGPSSAAVLSIALERGSDRLLLSGGLDGRVCLYRLDTPPEACDEATPSSRARTMIRALAASRPAGTAAARSGSHGSGLEDGHAGAVSGVQW